MYLSDIIDRIHVSSKRHGESYSRADISKIANRVVVEIKESLKNGEPVSILNFGSFKAVQGQARVSKGAVNSYTPPMKRVKFTASKKLTAYLNR